MIICHDQASWQQGYQDGFLGKQSRPRRASPAQALSLKGGMSAKRQALRRASNVLRKS
jgi:hypothetical protein